MKVSCRVLAQTEDAAFATLLEKQLIADFTRGGYPLCNVQGSGRHKATTEEKSARQKYLQALKDCRAEQLSRDLEQSLLKVRVEIESGRLDIQSILSGQN